LGGTTESFRPSSIWGESFFDVEVFEFSFSKNKIVALKGGVQS